MACLCWSMTHGYVIPLLSDVSTRVPWRTWQVPWLITMFITTHSCVCHKSLNIYYGVATMSRLLKIIGVFCRISSLLYDSFAKDTYNFKEPTTRSHLICLRQSMTHGHARDDQSIDWSWLPNFRPNCDVRDIDNFFVFRLGPSIQ